MQKLLFTLILSISIQTVFSQNLTELKVETFNLRINNIVNIDVIRSKDLIITNNILHQSRNNFQVEFHFDDGQLYYIRFLKPDLKIDRKYEIERTSEGGYGYRHITADYKIDFLFPREKQKNTNIVTKEFANVPDFSNDELMIYYFEELYTSIANYVALEIGTIAFHGDVVGNIKNNFLYYRFDNENFSPSQKIEIQDSYLDKTTKKFVGGYRIDFNRKQLKNHKIIYFSETVNNQKDTILTNQNSINLTKLREQIQPSRNETIINNDLFLHDNYGKIISQKNQITENEKQYIGIYTTKSSDKVTIELRADKIYYRKIGDEEQIGLWKWSEEGGKKLISIYNIYSINRKIGNKSRPSDVGSSFDILIAEERLLYPIAVPAYAELEKLKNQN